MPDITALAAHPGLIEVLAVSKGDQGPGALLRTVLIVGLVGVPLVAWLLLRGYRK